MESTKDNRRLLLILLAFFAGVMVPIQIITLSFGYAQYIKGVTMGPKVIMVAHQFAKYYIPFVYIPAIITLVVIILYSRKNYPDIYRRIVVGLGVGAISTIALDFFRQMGVIYSWLPGDTPAMFGKMATGSTNFSIFYPVGFFIHFLNGANFGLFYTFVWGKRPSYRSSLGWATFWVLIIELGMMTLPPVAPMTGAFGIRYAWPQLFLLTLVAHIAFGIALGILAQFYLKIEDRGGFFAFLSGSGKVAN